MAPAAPQDVAKRPLATVWGSAGGECCVAQSDRAFGRRPGRLGALTIAILRARNEAQARKARWTRRDCSFAVMSAPRCSLQLSGFDSPARAEAAEHAPPGRNVQAPAFLGSKAKPQGSITPGCPELNGLDGWLRASRTSVRMY